MRPGEMREAVILRDGRCMAPVLDPDAGPCHDQWGYAPRFLHLHELEADYVRRGAIGGRHELPADHVALCPGHHRGTGPSGGHVWATSHREEMREYLDRVNRA
jgi:hypothetical protein